MAADRSFARDLNLDQIVAAIAGDRKERELITRILFAPLHDADAVRYRQEVFQDLALRAPGDARQGWKERLGIGPRCLMLFNESFAGTNEREGSEIGRQVISALLDAGITVFFVTHRFGFAQHFHRQQAGSTLFLRAERQPDGRRDYKVAVKEPLPTSFGEDLYYRFGGWLEETKPYP